MNTLVKQMPATEVKIHLGQIVDEIQHTNIPVIIRNRGEARAVIVSWNTFQSFTSTEQTLSSDEVTRAEVRASLRAADFFSEPTAEELIEARTFEAQYPPEEQERILAEWRRLEIEPPLSEIILHNRD